jgi:cytochrome c nitrite reductase small subunit
MTRLSNHTRSGTMLLTLSLIAMLGIPFGLGIYTFSYAEGTSYLSNDSRSCLNCHVMQEQFDAWSHSSHKWCIR